MRLLSDAGILWEILLVAVSNMANEGLCVIYLFALSYPLIYFLWQAAMGITFGIGLQCYFGLKEFLNPVCYEAYFAFCHLLSYDSAWIAGLSDGITLKVIVVQLMSHSMNNFSWFL